MMKLPIKDAKVKVRFRKFLGGSAGAVLLAGADISARIIPTDIELKLGVVTALFGAPLFALIAWRAARSWRG